MVKKGLQEDVSKKLRMSIFQLLNLLKLRNIYRKFYFNFVNSYIDSYDKHNKIFPGIECTVVTAGSSIFGSGNKAANLESIIF